MLINPVAQYQYYLYEEAYLSEKGAYTAINRGSIGFSRKIILRMFQ